MGQYTRVNGKISKEMATEYNTGLWVPTTKVNGKKTNSTDMALLNIQTEMFTKEIGSTTAPADMEYS